MNSGITSTGTSGNEQFGSTLRLPDALYSEQDVNLYKTIANRIFNLDMNSSITSTGPGGNEQFGSTLLLPDALYSEQDINLYRTIANGSRRLETFQNLINYSDCYLKTKYFALFVLLQLTTFYDDLI